MIQSSPLDTQPLLAAEVPYFRVPRDDWELMLARMRQLGANTITTCVPWAWHEPQPGALDLVGASHLQRDLPGFVRLCGRLGFHVILKPGPFVEDGLLGGGLPPWLLRAHPEIHALRPDGQPWRHAGSGAPHVCGLHPAYLAAARSWIAALSAVAHPLQRPTGPIVAIQLDSATPGGRGGWAYPPVPPAGSEGDSRFRLDYNPYVVKTLWPQWLREHYGEGRGPKLADRGWLIDGSILDPPSAIRDPLDLGELRRYVDLDAFTDWFYTTAVATVAGWLREEGWAISLFHHPLATSWQAGGALADAAGEGHAAGWLGHSAGAEELHDTPSTQIEPALADDAAHQLSFEEYVYYALWRTRLARQLGQGIPAFAPWISAAQDFAFAAPFLGGLQGATISMALQTQPDNPGAGAFVRWAMEAPVRPDGSVRPRLWNTKAPFMLLGAAGADFAAAQAPADLALGYSQVPERVGDWVGAGELPGLAHITAGCDHALRSQALAQRLVRAGVAFDVIDLDAATDAELARYTLVVAPAAAVLARATQAKLARHDNLALVGDARARYDENLEECDILESRRPTTDERGPAADMYGGPSVAAPTTGENENTQHDSPLHPVTPSPRHLPEDVSGEQLGELIEERGGNARYAWADAADVDASVCHGPAHTYLFAANRQPAPYSGALTYRAPDGSIQHLHLGIGGLRVGMLILKDGEVLGAAIGGDGSEGGWLVRGMHTSMVFNNGAGVIAPCGAGLILSAPQSGRFQIRRPDGWDDMVAYRLLLSGALLPASFQIEAAHLTMPYVAEDERGQTDLYILLPERTPLPGMLRDYAATLLGARTAALLRAAEHAGAGAPGEAAEAASALALAAKDFAQAAGDLEQLAAHAYTLDEYGAAWQAGGLAARPAGVALARALAQARGDYLAGALDDALYTALEERIVRILGIVARGSLAHDGE